jgi:hypothetical protein
VFRREELNMNRTTVKLNASKVLNINKFCAIMIPEYLSMKNKFLRYFNKIGQNRMVGLPVHPRSKMADLPMEVSRVFDSKESGCAIAEAVSCWLPTAAGQVCVWAACGVCGGLSSTGQVFSEYFLRQSFPNFSIIIITCGWYNRPLVAAVPSGHKLGSTPHYTNLI